MKSIFAITMLIAMLLQTFSMGIIMGDFYIHREQITEELCENKDKPELHCLGNCQLKKELEKENKKEIPAQFKEITLFLKSEVFVFQPALIFEKGPSVHPQNDNRIFGYSASVFHPPA